MLREPGKTADSLPWLFYKDGVRELRFQKGFEQEDLVGLSGHHPARPAAIARRGRPARHALGARSPAPALQVRRAGRRGRPGHRRARRRRDEPHSDRAAARDDPVRPEEQLLESRPGLVNLADFDTTLYFLDEGEVAYLRTEVEAEYAGDLRQNVMAILLDIFETQDDAAIRDEIAGVLDLLIVHFLSAREFRAVAYLLKEARSRPAEPGSSQPAQRDRLDKRSGSTESGGRALPAAGVVRPVRRSASPVEDLTALFAELAAASAWRRSLPGCLAFRTARSRPAAGGGDAADGRQHEWSSCDLIGSANPTVALEAVRRAGAVRSPAAVTALVRRLGDADAAMRLAAVQSLGEIGSAGRYARARAGDRRRRPRCARRGRPRAGDARVSSRAPSFRGGRQGQSASRGGPDREDGVFEAYSVLVAKPASRCSTACSMRADFSVNATTARRARVRRWRSAGSGPRSALESLRRARNEKDVVVRNAVNKALRGWRRHDRTSSPLVRSPARPSDALADPSARHGRRTAARYQPASQRGGLRRARPPARPQRSCSRFYGAMRAIKLYPARECGGRQSARRSHGRDAARSSQQEQELEFRTSGEFIFINATRLRLDLDNYASFSHLLTLFRSGGIGSLRVTETVTPRDWLVFLSLVQAPARRRARGPLRAADGKLTIANVHSLELGPPSAGARRSATGNSPRKPPSGPTPSRSPCPRKSCTPCAWGARPTSRSSSASCRRSSTRS